MQLFQKSGDRISPASAESISAEGAERRCYVRHPLVCVKLARPADTVWLCDNPIRLLPRLHCPMLRQEPRWMNSAGKLTVSKLEPLFFCCIRLMDSTAARAIS